MSRGLPRDRRGDWWRARLERPRIVAMPEEDYGALVSLVEDEGRRPPWNAVADQLRLVVHEWPRPHHIVVFLALLPSHAQLLLRVADGAPQVSARARRALRQAARERGTG